MIARDLSNAVAFRCRWWLSGQDLDSTCALLNVGALETCKRNNVLVEISKQMELAYAIGSMVTVSVLTCTQDKAFIP